MSARTSSLRALEVKSHSEDHTEVVFLRDNARIFRSRPLDAIPHEGNVEVEWPERVDGQACDKVMRITSGFRFDQEEAVIQCVIDVLCQLVRVRGPRPQRTRFLFLRFALRHADEPGVLKCGTDIELPADARCVHELIAESRADCPPVGKVLKWIVQVLDHNRPNEESRSDEPVDTYVARWLLVTVVSSVRL